MGLLGILWTIIVGFVVGLIARALMPGVDGMGFWLTVLLGVGGSLIGGVIGSLLFRSRDGRYHPAGLVLSVIGAVILLWAYRRFGPF